MGDPGDSGKGRATVSTGKNDTPQRQRMLTHIRGGPQRPAARQGNQADADARRKAFVQAFEKEQALAKPVLDQASLLLSNQAIPSALGDEFKRTQRLFETGKKLGDVVGARARLGDHKKAAVDLINGGKAVEQKKAQLSGQAALFDEVAPVLDSVKKSSFPIGQAAYIAKQDLDAGKHFKEYLDKLAALEAKKAEGQKIAAAGGTTGPKFRADLKALCMALIAAADAHLVHYEKDLSTSQKADKSSMAKKRYCESGKLSARQFMIALDFEELGDPKSSGQGWSEEDQIRAATVRAKINYHQAYEEAAKLGDGGDAAGASESRWLQGLDFEQTAEAVKGKKPLRTRPGDDGAAWTGKNAEWKVTQNKRVAIFKPFDGEEKPLGFDSDKPGSGAVKEALASANARLLAAQTGIDLGVPETSVVAVPRYALRGGGSLEEGQNASGDDDVIGSAQNNAGTGRQIADLKSGELAKIKTSDVQKMAILDIMQLNGDRHGGNIMVKVDPKTGDPTLVPIDHGGSLPARADFAKARTRIAGIQYNQGAGVAVTNELLSMPAAYEPFTPELLAQLDLLDPAAIEAGMKRQRAAIDKVHPGLGAGAKVGDDSFHLSKRSMMFMKRAAKLMSPAEIQIALGQRGEELFDATDDRFDAVADQVIADFAPQAEAYKEIFTVAVDRLTAVVEWLESSGWTLYDPYIDMQSGQAFLMKDPELALKLYRSKATNAQPPQAQSLPDKGDAPALDKNRSVSDAVKQQISAAFPKAPAPPADSVERVWQRREFFWAKMAKAGGMTAYRNMLTLTGADIDQSPVDAFHSMVLWGKLNEAGNAPLLQQLRPTGAGQPANLFLTAYLKAGFNAAVEPMRLAQAQQIGATLPFDAGLKQAVEDTLDRVRNEAADPMVASTQQAVLKQVGVVVGLLTQQDWPAANAAANALERDVHRSLLAEIAVAAQTEADKLLQSVAAERMPPDVAVALGDVLSSCQQKKVLGNARFALSELQALAAKYAKVLAVMPAFSWDAKAASAAKKAAIDNNLIADKDTGISDALKAVSSAQSAFDEVLGPKVKADKKRPAGEKAIAAYEKFIQFVDTKLRPLSKGMAWAVYCNSAVKAANAKIAFIRTLMSNWP